MSSSTKMDTSEVFAMFETINSKLDKQLNKPVNPVQVDLSGINIMVERIKEAIRKSTNIEHLYQNAGAK